MTPVPAGKNLKVDALVLVHDQDKAPLPNAVVTGDWSFNGEVVQVGVQGTTDASGQTTLSSFPIKAETGDVYRLVVTSVALDGYTYSASDNLETEDSYTVE